jgi:tellurite resistance protein TerC
MSPLWIGFLVLVGALVWLDLGVLNRGERVLRTGEALGWTAVWVGCALAFNVAVYFLYRSGGVDSPLTGAVAAKMFFTGYLVEQSLSFDNVFMIALVFTVFEVPAAYQRRVLLWGIVGAIVLRGGMIVVGVALFRRFEFMTYLFGTLLLLTAVRLLRGGHGPTHPDRNPLVRLARKVHPVTATYEGRKFFSRLDDGRLAFTPLFVALLVVECTDVLFAVDSIPAIFAITRDPFLVFTSNIFAILGLRSLYFVLAGMMRRFRHVRTSLVFMLGFIAAKMLLAHVYDVPIDVSLFVLLSLLALGVLASLAQPRGPKEEPQPELPGMEDQTT